MSGRWRLQRPSQAPPDTPITTRAEPPGPRLVCPGLEECSPLGGPSRRTDHRLGRGPCPPRPVFPGLGDCSPPRKPSRTHQTPLEQDSLSPWDGVPRPWRLQPPRRPYMTHQPPRGKDPVSPQACVPGPWRLQPPSQALQDAPTTAGVRLPVSPGRCARALETAAPLAGPPRRTNHRPDMTACPPRMVCPGLGDCNGPHRPIQTYRSPPRQNPLDPRLVCPGLEECSPLGSPSGRTDQRLGRVSCPPRPVCPSLEHCSPPRMRFRTHRPPLAQDSLSAQAGVPGPWRLRPIS